MFFEDASREWNAVERVIALARTSRQILALGLERLWIARQGPGLSRHTLLTG